jgi:hypothetical protein
VLALLQYLQAKRPEMVDVVVVALTHAAASDSNQAGIDCRASSHRATVGPQNLMVRPSLKNGTRFALTQRSKVRGATFRMRASSETPRAESALRSLSTTDRGEAVVVGANHAPCTVLSSGCA